MRRRVLAALFVAVLIGGGQVMADAPPEGPHGKWTVQEIAGQPVLAETAVTMEIGADGRATGSGGCNRFTGPVQIAGEAISFGPAASTRMMCAPDVSEQEAKFFRTLEQAQSWRRAGDGLVLLDGTGEAVLRLGGAP